MKKIILVFITVNLLSCKSSQVSAQKKVNYISYYSKVYEANSLYKSGEKEKTFQILNSLFKEFEPLNQDIIYEMEIYIRLAFDLNQKDKIKPVLVALISKWGYLYKYLDTDIKEYVNLSIGEVEALENKYNQNIDWSLRDSIVEMNVLDQKYRVGIHTFKSKQDSLNVINSIDKKHYKSLTHLWKLNPLDKTEIGNRKRKENTSLDGLLIHIVDEDKTNELKIQAYKYLIEGKLTPLYYALLIDRDLLNKGEKQKFYSFNSNDTLTNVDTNQINIYRKSIGLNQLDE